jgi:hypothetical protein
VIGLRETMSLHEIVLPETKPETEWVRGRALQKVSPTYDHVAYLSYAALPADAPDDAVAVPIGSPTVAVEILSPDDRRADVDHKIATYLAAGTAAVIVVDPPAGTMTVHDADGRRCWRDGDTLTHRALPGLQIEVGDLFRRAKH